MREMKLVSAAAILLLGASAGRASADLVYVCDIAGNVGVWDTATSSGEFLGDLSGHKFLEIVGLAYDASTTDVLVLDRGLDLNGEGAQVFSMDATQGTASFLMSTISGFEGGAVKGNLLYGIVEKAQVVAAFSIPDGDSQGLSGDDWQHSHAMGIDVATGQLYTVRDAGGLGLSGGINSIHRVNDDGTDGGVVVVVDEGDILVDDIDPFQGDFLIASRDSPDLLRVDSDTGDVTIFLDEATLASMGLETIQAGNGDGVRGVVVVSGCPWDLDGDQTVNIFDMLLLIASWGPCADPADCPADFDGSGAVGIPDLLALLANFGPCPNFDPLPCPWDFNGDGQVDETDVQELLENLGPCEDPADCPWDLDGDGDVDFDDLDELLVNLGPCP